MKIKSNIHDYTVNIETDFSFADELTKRQNTLYVIDKNVYSLYRETLFTSIPNDRLMIIEALEDNKIIETALEICEVMTHIPAKRNAHLVSFGGGIIQDITGFAANILYRGVHWTFVPTTLLAACDSCIGGKTSINYKHYKNLLGTFFPPEQIYICPLFFKTLSNKDFMSGLGEVVKFNIMSGVEGLARIEDDTRILLQRDEKMLSNYLESSLIYKKAFVEEDEFDRGIRIHLNFAHTFGHAFETVSNYFIPHGTAVAMGMIVANRISLKRGYLQETLVSRSENILSQIIDAEYVRYNFEITKLIDAIRKDKKQTSDELTAILLYDNMKLGVFKDLRLEEITYGIDSLYKCFES